MTFTLDQFCVRTRAEIEGGAPGPASLDRIAGDLARLIANPEFVASAFGPEADFSKKVLHQDDATGFYVLAHVHRGPKEGPPHSHGASWAVYGTAMGVTGMKEWARVNPDGEEAALLRMSSSYDLAFGETRGYGPHVIHSTLHTGTAWVIRVTGTNLDELPRYRFKKNRDRIVERS